MKKIDKLNKKVEEAINDGRYESAINHLTSLIEIEPLILEYYFKRANVFLRLQRFEEGLKDYAFIVNKDNANIGALTNFGACLFRCNKINEAKEILEYTLEISPDNFDALINLGSVFQAMNKPEECLKIAIKAIQVRPNAAIAYNNLGTALGDLTLNKDSREAFLTANQLDPTYTTTIINLAQLEVKLGNNHKGIELYEKALKLPNITSLEIDLINYYLSYSYLEEGNLKKGWQNFECGFSQLIPLGARRSIRKFKAKKWDGQNIGSSKLMVWREQGLGDELTFSSCFVDLHADKNCVNVIIECEGRLIQIYKRIFPKFIYRVPNIDSEGYTNEDFEYQCAMGSLPKIYRNNIENFNFPPMQFKALESKIIEFKKRLKNFESKMLVGICWRSGLLNVARNNDYTALDDWSILLSVPNIQLVNLQYGDCENELKLFEEKNNISILRWEDIDLKNDLESVIAICSELNCVASVATAVTYLSGFSGAKTYLMTHNGWNLLGSKSKLPWCNAIELLIADFEKPVATCLDVLKLKLLNFTKN